MSGLSRGLPTRTFGAGVLRKIGDIKGAVQVNRQIAPSLREQASLRSSR